jgi:hypothetical protein
MTHGIVNFGAIQITLSQEAYCNNAGQYLAAGTGSDGNEYLVEWATTAAWDDAQELCRTTGEVSGFAEDESKACDWDSPTQITPL